MRPIFIEVVSNVLTIFSHCSRCELIFKESGVAKRIKKEEIEGYPSEMKEEFLRLSEWISELCRLYRHRIRIRLIDAQSLLGIYKSLIHRFRKYPAFIIDKKDVYIGWDRQKLEDLLDEHLKAARI